MFVCFIPPYRSGYFIYHSFHLFFGICTLTRFYIASFWLKHFWILSLKFCARRKKIVFTIVGILWLTLLLRCAIIFHSSFNPFFVLLNELYLAYRFRVRPCTRLSMISVGSINLSSNFESLCALIKLSLEGNSWAILASK